MPRPNYRVNVANPPRTKPMMIWDGDCHFCGKWIRRWRQATDDQVEYVPYQQVLERFPEIGQEAFSKAVYFVGLNGIAVRGAEAVFACLAFAGRYSSLQGLYYRFEWFASLTSMLYSLVARNRSVFSAITSFLWGKSVEYSTYRFSGALFQRGLGALFFIAFLSFGVQMAGLTGSQGILPVSEHLDAIRQYLAAQGNGQSPMLLAPSLLWLNASDAMLNAVVWVGSIFALLLIFGLLPGLSSLMCWLLYLSLVNAVPVFLNYQWDALLLEAGFLAIFLAPWVLHERLSAPREPSRIARWLVWWLIFRLMLESGIVKLLDYPGVTENTWLNLTALNYHYFTQPIPNNFSVFMHALPEWFQQASVLFMFFAELVVPFFLFFPRRLRNIGCLLLIVFQILILFTGNYGFFNLLTIVLCLLLIDDQSLPQKIQAWLKKEPEDTSLQKNFALIGWLRVPLAALFFFMGALQIGQTARVVEFSEYKKLDKPEQPPWIFLYEYLQRIKTLNYYGLFRVMTTERPEIVIEGSDDMRDWHPYVFRYKPGPIQRKPSWATPHMPRLDWQLWFAALDARHHGYPGWFGDFLEALADNRPAVSALLEKNPFPDKAPRYLRVRLYDYRFNTYEQRAETGELWQRKLLPEYTLQLRSDQIDTVK